MGAVAIIVGSGGQDGRLLTKKLSALGYWVVGLTRGSFDIMDAQAVNELIGRLSPREVYFLAAYHHSSEDEPMQFGDLLRGSLDVNAVAAVNFLDAIEKFSPRSRFFYASSSLVFEASTNDLQTEESTLKPETPYAISKVAGMMACRCYRENKGVFASIGILYNHESPLRSSRFVTQKIVQSAVRIAREGAGTLKLGSLDAKVDWGYAEDYVEAMYQVLQLDQPNEFIVATGKLHSVKDFASLAFKRVGLNFSDHLELTPDLLARHNLSRCGDATRLRKSTGWGPTVRFEQLVEIMVDSAMDDQSGTIARPSGDSD